MMEAEGGVCKWIGGTPKPIYLIDAWTRSTSLTSGANCKLDFFFFLHRFCSYVTSVCHLFTTVSRGTTQYTDIMNSTMVSVSYLLRPGIVRAGVMVGRKDETKAEDSFSSG